MGQAIVLPEPDEYMERAIRLAKRKQQRAIQQRNDASATVHGGNAASLVVLQ